MRTCALFGAKIPVFLHLWCVRTGRKGMSQCGHFSDKEGGQIFEILCERVLWTAPYWYLIYRAGAPSPPKKKKFDHFFNPWLIPADLQYMNKMWHGVFANQLV